jgi:hypothetical protein
MEVNLKTKDLNPMVEGLLQPGRIATTKVKLRTSSLALLASFMFNFTTQR